MCLGNWTGPVPLKNGDYLREIWESCPIAKNSLMQMTKMDTAGLEKSEVSYWTSDQPRGLVVRVSGY